MTENEAEELLRRFHNGDSTHEENTRLTNWYLQMEATAPEPKLTHDDVRQGAEIWKAIEKKKRPVYYWAAAAIVFIFATSYLYFFYRTSEKKQDLYTYNKAHDIPAGRNKAVLTLSNGQQINLDNAKAGALANQGGVIVSKSQNGQIAYTVYLPQGERSVEVQYNTISTPNGGQYQVILPDGSKVWLNAASSLKYPVKFAKNERRVLLTGEGYFEVSKNTKQPFVVVSVNQTVKVLGTHFNINAYDAGVGPVKTTLAEGKVVVTILSQTSLLLPSKTLKPGEQVVNSGSALQLQSVNVDDVLAWKDGFFLFDQASTKSVFQQIARWYNVDVDYSTLPDGHFDGAMSRDQPLSELLKAIEVTNHVKIKIEGKRITVQK